MLNQLFGSNKPPAVDLTEGLVAHYLLNNNADDNNGTYDGTPSGGVDFQGDVSSFDGVDDKVTLLSPIPNSSNITVSVWFTVDTITNALRTIFSLFDNNTMYLTVRDEISVTNYLRAQIGDSGYMFPTFPLVANTLYHAALVGDISLGTAKLYINGNLEFTSTSYTTNAVLGRQDTIGAYTIDATTLDFYQDGTISNFRIYNEAKDQAFVDALYAEGYYPKPLPLPTTEGLIAHYSLTGTAEDTTGNYDSTEVSATYKDDAEFGSVYDGVGSITINTTATGLAVWCCYWIDTGTGWVFTKTTTIPSTLTANAYRNLRLYSLTPSVALQDEIEEYEKNFRPIDIDDGLVAYYPLANNSLDNYKNQYDGVDTAMTYNGLSSLFNGSTSSIAVASIFSGLTQFTISLWVKLDNISGDKSFVSRWGGSSDQILFYHDDPSGLRCIFRNADVTYRDYQTNIILTPNVWTNIIVTFDTSGVYKFYKNGNYADGTILTAGTINTFGDTVRIGNDDGTRIVAGNIAHTRIYNKAITAEQVAVIYNTEKGDFI